MEEESAAAKESKLCKVSGDNSLRDPPVPIPNTEVKPQHADSTWLETARKGRSSPDHSESHSKEWLSFLVERKKGSSRYSGE